MMHSKWTALVHRKRSLGTRRGFCFGAAEMDRRPKDVRPWAIAQEGWDYVEGWDGLVFDDIRPSA